jgi:hypothetical protein
MSITNKLGGGSRSQSYLGTKADNPANVIPAKRDPTSDDVSGYVPGTLWINIIDSTIWILASVIATIETNGEQQATWYQIAPISGSSALSLIETKTAASVTELTFTTGISASFVNYLMIFRNVTCASASNTDLFIQLSVNGGASYISTGYRNNSAVDNGLQMTNISNSATVCFSTGYLYNLTTGVGYISSSTKGTNLNAGTSSFDGGGNASYETPDIVVNAIRVVMANSGAFSGVFSLYSITQ